MDASASIPFFVMLSYFRNFFVNRPPKKRSIPDNSRKNPQWMRSIQQIHDQFPIIRVKKPWMLQHPTYFPNLPPFPHPPPKKHSRIIPVQFLIIRVKNPRGTPRPYILASFPLSGHYDTRGKMMIFGILFTKFFLAITRKNAIFVPLDRYPINTDIHGE